MALNGSWTSEPIGKMPKWPLSAHKQSSTVDRCQNQLARCPNSTWCAHTVLNVMHISRPNGKNPQRVLHIHKWEGCPRPTSGLIPFGARHLIPNACFHSNKEDRLAASANRRNREDPLKTNGFGSCWGTSPKSPFRSQLVTSSRLIHCKAMGNPGEPGVIKAQELQQSSPRWVTKNLLKVGSWSPSKAYKRPDW